MLIYWLLYIFNSNSFYSAFDVILVCDPLAASGNESLTNFKNVTANQCVRQSLLFSFKSLN